MATLMDITRHVVADMTTNFGEEFVRNVDVDVSFNEIDDMVTMFTARVSCKGPFTPAFFGNLDQYCTTDRLSTSGVFILNGLEYVIGDGDDGTAVTFDSIKRTAFIWVRVFH